MVQLILVRHNHAMKELTMITSLERLRRKRSSVCSACGWDKILDETNRYACVNPLCSGARDERTKAQPHA